MNAAFDSGQSSYVLRINCFGDLELEECARDYLGLGVLSNYLFKCNGTLLIHIAVSQEEMEHQQEKSHCAG